MNAHGEFKIEDGIPIPQSGTINRYPWKQLAVGQSFFVPNGTRTAIGACIAGANKSKHNNGAKFSLRSVEGGVRVWRIA